LSWAPIRARRGLAAAFTLDHSRALVARLDARARVDARDTIARVVTVVVVVIVDVERRRASTNRASFAAASSEGRRAT
jgi:hypothetical protein